MIQYTHALPPHVPPHNSFEELRDMELRAYDNLPAEFREALRAMPETMPDASLLITWVLRTQGKAAAVRALPHIHQTAQHVNQKMIEVSWSTSKPT